MKLSWDENKRNHNIQNHKIDFIDAERIFSGPTFTTYDHEHSIDEMRYKTLGLLYDVVVHVVHKDISKDKIRIISIRKATKDEQKRYYRGFPNRP